jgi:signal transduction histidine kinase
LARGWIEVAVRDDGHGISAANQTRVFQPYFTTKDTGTGLGLFVCKHLVENSVEGRIELSETSPSGTKFTVFLTCENVRQHPDVAPPSFVSTEVS